MIIRELQATTSPHPFGLVTSLKEDGRTNLMALSWWTFVSNTPPLLAIAVSNRGYTGTCIRRTGEFGLCLVGKGLKDRALRCGACSGRDRDKAAELSIELEDAAAIGAKLVKESCAALECRLTDALAAGDHTIYVAQIVEARAKPEIGGRLYAWEGYRRLDPLRP